MKIIKAQNWDRQKSPPRPSWLFIPPSPAVSDLETALLYPGTGLLEGINVSEGRGTKFPFKVFGAPWIDETEIQDGFEDLHLPGITAKAYSFTPTSGVYRSQVCRGLELIVSDPVVFRPVQTGLKLIRLISSLYPGYCTERLYKTVANPTGKSHLDRLTGVFHCFDKVKSNQLEESDLSVSDWKDIMKPFVLYS